MDRGRLTANSYLIARIQDLEDSLMDAASWKGKPANRLTKGIVLILIAAVAIGLLVSATFALVELN